MTFVLNVNPISQTNVGGGVCQYLSEEIEETTNAKFLFLSHGFPGKAQFNSTVIVLFQMCLNPVNFFMFPSFAPKKFVHFYLVFYTFIRDRNCFCQKLLSECSECLIEWFYILTNKDYFCPCILWAKNSVKMK